MGEKKPKRVICEDCGCLGIQHGWGVECERCDAESQLNDTLQEKRMLENLIKKCEEARDLGVVRWHVELNGRRVE